MKTLYEGILSGIEDQIKAGDDYIDAISELDATKKLSKKSWETLVTGELVYVLNCPKFLAYIGVDKYNAIQFEMTFWDGDTNSKGYYNQTAEIDIALLEPKGYFSRIYFDNFYVPQFKTREAVWKYVIKLIKDNINSKNAEKIKDVILSQQ